MILFQNGVWQLRSPAKMATTVQLRYLNQRLPGACNRSPGSKLLSITTQLHCGGHLGRRAQLPDTILGSWEPLVSSIFLNFDTFRLIFQKL
jgi:hypothetical protein